MDDAHDWQALYPAGLARAWSPPEQPLWRFLADAAERTPDAVALTFGGTACSYGALWDHARAMGGVLRAGGVVPGDRVLIVLPNCPEFVAAYYGALAAGCVAVAASPYVTVPEIEEVLRAVAPRGIVHQAGAPGDLVRTAVARSGADVAVFAPTRLGHGHFELRDAPRIEPFASAPGDLAVLQTTSGTTGGLKAARMSHRNLVANALQNNLWFGWTRDDVILGALPLCHTWGMSCVMNAALAAGARIALLPTNERAQVTVAYGSATMFHKMLDTESERYGSLRYVKAGAMLVGSDLHARWTAAVPSVPMINGYGLTEAGPEVTNNPPHARRPGTVGIPLPGTELRLAPVTDADGISGADAGAIPGAGEVQIRGPQVMSGYWRNDDATRAAFTGDGWLRTGDLARFDEAGYLVILDRLKDLIKHRGWSIVPGEVERALRAHPAVAEACVVGVPHARDGEEPVACIVLRDGAEAPSAEEWRAHLDPLLARFKHPQRFDVVAEIPKNHVGKPLRRVLRESLRA